VSVVDRISVSSLKVYSFSETGRLTLMFSLQKFNLMPAKIYRENGINAKKLNPKYGKIFVSVEYLMR
jgi:hypothetical protein